MELESGGEPEGYGFEAGLDQVAGAGVLPPLGVVGFEDGFGLLFCRSEFQGKGGIGRFGHGSLPELGEHLLLVLHVEHGDGRVAEGASGVGV